MGSLAARMRWYVARFIEDQIHALITDRILAYHRRLIRDGFIPDLAPPYQGRSLAGATVQLDQAPLVREGRHQMRDGHK